MQCSLIKLDRSVDGLNIILHSIFANSRAYPPSWCLIFDFENNSEADVAV